MSNHEVPFPEAIKTESDEYLGRYLKRSGKDSITMMHKGAVKAEIERRTRAIEYQAKLARAHDRMFGKAV